MQVDEVRTAMHQLTAAGRPPTFTAVRAVLGYGSKRHILEHMKTVKKEMGMATAPTDPQGLYDQLLEHLQSVHAELAQLEAAESLSRADVVRQAQLQRTMRTMQQRLPGLEKAALQHSATRALAAAESLWAALQARKQAAWDGLDQAVQGLEQAFSLLATVHGDQQRLVPELPALPPVVPWLVTQRLWRFLGRALRELEDPNIQHPRQLDQSLHQRIQAAYRHNGSYHGSFTPRKE